jgi:WD40 repeat protein
LLFSSQLIAAASVEGSDIREKLLDTQIMDAELPKTKKTRLPSQCTLIQEETFYHTFIKKRTAVIAIRGVIDAMQDDFFSKANYLDIDGNTLLDLALAGGDDAMVTLIQSYGVHRACDLQLQCAIEGNKVDEVATLLDAGADYTLTYPNGKGYLHLVAREGFVDLLPLLLPHLDPHVEEGEHVEDDDEKRASPIRRTLVDVKNLWHIFIEERAALTTLKALLAVQGDTLLATINELNELGDSPLDLAIATYGAEGTETLWLQGHGALGSEHFQGYLQSPFERDGKRAIRKFFLESNRRLENLEKQLGETEQKLADSKRCHDETRKKLADSKREHDETRRGLVASNKRYSEIYKKLISIEEWVTKKKREEEAREHLGIKSHYVFYNTLIGHSHYVMSVSFSTDGGLLASASHDHSVRLWNPAVARHVRTLMGHTNVAYCVIFSPNGKLLASASWDKSIRLYKVGTGKRIGTLIGHAEQVYGIAFSVDGKMLASGSDDKSVRLWNPATGAHLRTLIGHTSYVNSVAFSLDGTLASGSADSIIRLWNSSTGEHLHTLEGHTDWVWSVAFSPNGKLLASGSDDKSIQLWSPSTGTHLRTLTGHTARVCSVIFSADGSLLASGSNDNNICLWNPATGEHLRTLTGHTDKVMSVAFSTDGRLLASASEDKTIRLWKRISTWEETKKSEKGSTAAADEDEQKVTL